MGGNGSKKRILAGTHRAQPVGETLAVLQRVAPAFGITRVANITGLDDVGIPTVVVVRPEARSLSVSQGKGIDLESAKVSGLMESLEQFHAEHAPLPVTIGTYRDKRQRGSVVDLSRLPGSWRRPDSRSRLLWVQAATLDGGRMDVPFSMVHLDLTHPLPLGSGFFPMGSNGLASGNCFLEALLHGAWELIERDALALFYQRPLQDQLARRVALDTVDDPTCLQLLRRFEAAGVAVGAWDMTSDVGIAAFACSIVEREYDPFRRVGLARGFGCHIDRRVALSRALCEAAQSRLTRISGSRDDLQSLEVDQIRSQASIIEHQRVLEAAGSRRFLDAPTRLFDTFEDDLNWTRERLGAVDCAEILFVELAPQASLFSVVRVIIPGLEGAPDVPGYIPGKRASRPDKELV